MFICGSFHNQEDDDASWRACPSPKKSRRSASFKIKDNHSKNPYATRGLDKFDALLAELDDKKQKIYTQKGAEDISLVRFVYSNDNKIKPLVVVRVKEKKQTPNLELSDKHTIESAKAAGNIQVQIEKKVDEKQCSATSCDFKVEKLRQPFYYMPLVTILILLFLAVYGRSFAIVCTSLGWYLMSTIKGADLTLKRMKKKKDYSRGISDKKLGIVINNGLQKKEYTRRLSDKSVFSDGSFSPTSVMNGPMDISPRQHGHRRSF